MKRAIACLLVISLALLLKSCNTTEPPPPPPDGEKPTLALKLEDVSCTEAWIELTTTNLSLPATITLKKDNVGQTISLSTADTILYVDSLLPNQSYKYQASSIPQSGGQQQVSSNELNVTTMDTTSHDFTFQSWTFGTIGSSTLYDVAIINENNIWAVGEILVADTSINGYTMYNAVHWDGVEWKLHRIMFYTICGQQHQNAYAASSIFAFSENDIWVGMQGSQIARLNDTTQISTYCIPISVRKLWGTDSQNLYAVGVNGQIAHYNGTRWSRIESGTELNINDIWGDYNEKTNEWEILAVASNYSSSWEKEIFLIKNNELKKISTDSRPTMEPLLTTWFKANRQYYVAGAGIYQKRLLQDSLWKHNLFNITTFATTSIRGNNINDVIGVGAFGDFVHFNGVNWKNDYQEPLLSNGSYTEVTVKGDLVVAVGGNQVSINSEAVILVGRR